jgi:hypothetical protein
MKRIAFELKLLFIPCKENDFKPHLLQSRILFVYLAALVSFKIISIIFVIYFPNTIHFADVSENLLVALTNQQRQEEGLPVLEQNPVLSKAAYQKAQDMIANNYFAHQSPTGLTPWHWFSEVDYDYRAAGENLAIGFLDSEEVVQAWMDSPTHRANLLNSEFEEIGIAVLKGDFNGKETTIIVQHFGSPLAVKTEEIPSLKEETIPVIEEPEKELAEEPLQKDEIAKVVAGETSVKTSLFEFFALHYSNILQGIIIASLMLVALALILDIFIQIKIQDRFLILKSVLLLVMLALLFFLNKESIIDLIPHNLRI